MGRTYRLTGWNMNARMTATLVFEAIFAAAQHRIIRP